MYLTTAGDWVHPARLPSNCLQKDHEILHQGFSGLLPKSIWVWIPSYYPMNHLVILCQSGTCILLHQHPWLYHHWGTCSAQVVVIAKTHGLFWVQVEEGCQSTFNVFSDDQEVHLVAGTPWLKISPLVYVRHQHYHWFKPQSPFHSHYHHHAWQRGPGWPLNTPPQTGHCPAASHYSWVSHLGWILSCIQWLQLAFQEYKSYIPCFHHQNQWSTLSWHGYQVSQHWQSLPKWMYWMVQDLKYLVSCHTSLHMGFYLLRHLSASSFWSRTYVRRLQPKKSW